MIHNGAVPSALVDTVTFTGDACMLGTAMMSRATTYASYVVAGATDPDSDTVAVVDAAATAPLPDAIAVDPLLSCPANTCRALGAEAPLATTTTNTAPASFS